jgi:hypothetical protein
MSFLDCNGNWPAPDGICIAGMIIGKGKQKYMQKTLPQRHFANPTWTILVTCMERRPSLEDNTLLKTLAFYGTRRFITVFRRVLSSGI